MRVVLTIALIASIILATHAMSDNPFEAFRYQQMVKKAAASVQSFHNSMNTKKFTAQQNSEVCTSQEASTVMIEALTACGTAATFLGTTHATLTEANAAYTEFCNSDCKKFIDGMDKKYIPCFPAEQVAFLDYTPFMCSSHGANNCGAVISQLGNIACAATTPSACTGSCQWNSRTNECDAYVTNTVLDNVCSPCLTDFIKKFELGGGVAGPDAAAGVNMVQSTLCAKVDGQWCMPQVQNLLGTPNFATKAGLDSMCTPASKTVCLKKVMQAVMVPMRSHADKAFTQCTKFTSTATGIFQCKKAYEASVGEMQVGIDYMGWMCLKNNNGQYCLPNVFNMTQETCLLGAFGGTCATGCDTQVKTYVDNAGCCIGTLQALIAAGAAGNRLSQDQFPPHTQIGTPITHAPVTMGPTISLPPAVEQALVGDEVRVANPAPGMFANLGACPSVRDTIGGTLGKRCGLPVPAGGVAGPIKKELPISLSFAKVSANPAVKKRVVDALVRDVATSTGLSPKEIKNADLVEDKSIQVTVATSSRQMAVLATESGCKFTFDIDSIDPTVANLASKDFDKKIENQDLALTETIQVSKTECSNCLPASGSLQATLPPSGPNTNTTGSSASALSGVLALVAVIIALVL